MRKPILARSVAVLLAGSAAMTLAHHSSAQYDSTKEVTVIGKVMSMQFTNPHSWLLVSAVDSQGKTKNWAFEAEGPSTLLRAGIKRDSLMPGEMVTVTGHPLLDNRPGALLVKVVKADGTVLNPRPAPPPLPRVQ